MHVLWSVARRATTTEVVREMVTTGAVRKLCVMVGQDEIERARETLRMHAAAWRSLPCLDPNLHALYTC